MKITITNQNEINRLLKDFKPADPKAIYELNNKPILINILLNNMENKNLEIAYKETEVPILYCNFNEENIND